MLSNWFEGLVVVPTRILVLELKKVDSLVDRSSYLIGVDFAKGLFVSIPAMFLEIPEAFSSFDSPPDTLTETC